MFEQTLLERYRNEVYCNDQLMERVEALRRENEQLRRRALPTRREIIAIASGLALTLSVAAGGMMGLNAAWRIAVHTSPQLVAMAPPDWWPWPRWWPFGPNTGYMPITRSPKRLPGSPS